ncbi:MAG: ferrochelatase [Desulfobulbaceae bacterium A2]|nr:MAG: ferrochelatase [Desulfobulbaceae bacterium A2]
MTDTAVVLLNLGGPERLEDVGPFLSQLFADRRIIRLGPAFLQRPLARLIAWRRTPKSRASYQRIGGGSPLNRITRQQADALAAALLPVPGMEVAVAMRYWQPRAQPVLASLVSRGVRRIIALPLYPHYSRATSGSSLEDLSEAAVSLLTAPSVTPIRSWADHPAYIACLARRIREGWERCGREGTALVYSAHSLPQSFIDEGDPYLAELQRSIAAVETVTGIKGRLCFQSRSGPVRWLAPSTPETLHGLAAEGCRQVLVVPLSFVSDHVETLGEIDIDYHRLAAELGMRLVRTASFNAESDFIACLRDLVLAAL